MNQLQVVEHTHQAHGNIAHKLRRTVGAGAKQGFPVEAAFSETQKAGIRPQEVDNRDDGTQNLRNSRGNRRAHQPPVEHSHKESIQNNVADACRDHHRQRQIGLFRRDAETLKGILHHIGRQRQLNDDAIGYAILQNLSGSPQSHCCRSEEGNGSDGEHHCTNYRSISQQRKDFIGFFRIAHAQCHGNQGRTAAADHKADGAKHHQIRHNEIDGCKSGLARIVGDKNTVNHTVDGGKNHHDNGGKGEAQKAAIGEMIG